MYKESCIRGETLEVQSIKQFAENQNVSYEAIRKQIVRYSKELNGHIIRKNRTQFLDEWAVDFLKKKRRENPVILMNTDVSEENERLREQIETLKTQLLTAQNELLASQKRIIDLQDEAKKTLEDRARYTALLEDNKEKEEKLTALSRQIQTQQTESDKLRETIANIEKERDEAQTEAQSFIRSIFGLYRKK